MRINKEDFNKLKQLDRIEFRQKLENCYNYKSIKGVFHILIILTAIFTVGSYIDLRLFSAATIFLKASFLVFILHLFNALISNIVTNNRIRKLEEEYFKIEVKKK